MTKGNAPAAMLSGIRGVLFDLDGTLIDSMWMWEAIDVEYLGKKGYTVPGDLRRAIEGMSFDETAAYFKDRFHLPDSLEEIGRDWIAMSEEKYEHEVPLKPGAGELLAYLRANHIRTAIATSNGRRLVRAVMRSLSLDTRIDTVITGDDVANGKPAPDIYLAAAGDLGISPGKCLVFEDVASGILAGKSAGARVCSVDDPASQADREEIRRLADYSITGFPELLDSLEKEGL